MSETGARARDYFLSRIWDAYADFYDAYRVDTGDAHSRIRPWSELSLFLRNHFETEFDPLSAETMKLVQDIALDDADG